MSDTKAFWFSPDSSLLLYAAFDDSKVGKVTVNMYHSAEFSASSTVSAKADSFDKFAYPSPKTLRYPKVRRIIP